MKVMIREFMPSEESGNEMIDGKRRAVIKVKALPWRSSRIGRIFKRLKLRMEIEATNCTPCIWQSISKTTTGRLCIRFLRL